MAVKLGLFTMPFHHPARDYATVLEEDQEAIVLADRLGFTEAFVGEHFSSGSERITSPLIFLATLIHRTRQIRFGTGVLNLPQFHPATVAAYAAMFDHLCRGRFILGIGPGGLVSDFELFDVGQAELRPQMMLESIDTILTLWTQDPPYEIDGRFWKISVKHNRRPDPDVWRVSRSVLVTETDAEAEDYLADRDTALSFYYRFMHYSFTHARKALFMLKPDLEVPDEDVTVDTVKRALIIAGSPRRVLDQLVALRDEIGHFGTLLMAGHDWDRPALWRRSMEMLATEVMPPFARHAAATRPR